MHRRSVGIRQNDVAEDFSPASFSRRQVKFDFAVRSFPAPRANAPSSSRIIPKRCCRGAPSPAILRLAWKPRAFARPNNSPLSRHCLPRWASNAPRTNTRDQLSGGMQQRVQIARCLAQRPKILLMDEPFGALDAMTRQALQDEILALSGEQHMTVVFITHDLEEAIYLGDRVVVLGDTPARIIESIDVDLPHPRDQLTTREDPRFLAHRHRLFGLLRRD